MKFVKLFLENQSVLGLVILFLITGALLAPTIGANNRGYQPGVQHLYPYYAPDFDDTLVVPDEETAGGIGFIGSPVVGETPSTINCEVMSTPNGSRGFIATTSDTDSNGVKLLQPLTVLRYLDPDKTSTTYVHRCLISSLSKLFDHYNNQVANSNQEKLGGWVWRSHARQIELRKAHCDQNKDGILSYAETYEISASKCSPPTARPGTSSHQQGLAVDFYCQAGVMNLRSGNCVEGFRWLENHAACYGLINLPSENWHWYFSLSNKGSATLQAKYNQANCTSTSTEL